MNGPRFDELTKVLAKPASRRAALKAMTGAALGGLGIFLGGRERPAEAGAGCGTTGAPCCRSIHGAPSCFPPNVCNAATLTCALCGTGGFGGTCGGTCPSCHAPWTCVSGACGCGTGLTACPSGGSPTTCANLQTDNNNCGACGTVCSGGKVCTGGVCGCATGTTACTVGESTVCVNEQTNNYNCGACGHVCTGGTGCVSGACVQTPSVVVVKAANLEHSTDRTVAAADNTWFFYNDETDVIDNSLGSFVTGPGTPPAGSGSAQITASGTQRRNLATYQFRGTKLSDITTLKFSTYNAAATNHSSPNASGYLNFNVDFTGTGVFQKRLGYLPSVNGSITPTTWKEWDTIDGGNGLWFWSGFTWNGTLGTKWPDSSTTQYRKWSDILATWPNATVLLSDPWLGVRVGEPYPNGYTENIDAFRFGTSGGTTTFDFEP